MLKIRTFLNLSKASIDTIKTKAKTIIIKMTGNANFVTPSPTLPVVSAQLDLMSTKQAEQLSAMKLYKQKSKELKIERDNLLNMLDTLGTYIETTASNDEPKILSSGFDLKQHSAVATEIAIPIHLLLREGEHEGEVKCNWSKVKNAKAYIVEMTTDINDPTKWKYVQTITKTSAVVKNLIISSRVWIRIAAVGPAGTSGYCDVATRIVS